MKDSGCFNIGNRIGEYLKPYLDDYVFDNLSENYLKKAGVYDILNGVPVPIKKTELSELTNIKIAHSMAIVMGCDVKFPYIENYTEYIKRTFGRDFIMPLLSEGVELAAEGKSEEACILFRSVLVLEPNNQDGLYCYGRALKDSYEIGEGEEYVGRFKAEALEVFERLTIEAPDFSMGYYFLAYAYLNLGLYTKALLTFKDFIRVEEENGKAQGLSEEESDRREYIKEAGEWVDKLQDPVKIEGAYNKVLSGQFEEGIKELLPYTEDARFKDWWPLYYYLGVAHKDIGRGEEAVGFFKEVLKYSPSDLTTLQELVDTYEILGDEEMVQKYSNKIQIVKRNREEERAEKLGTVVS